MGERLPVPIGGQIIRPSLIGAPSILVPEKRIEEDIKTLLKVWARRTPPEDQREIFGIIRKTRQLYLNPKAFTKNKVGIHLSEIPTRIQRMMERCYRIWNPDAVMPHEWRNDKRVMNIFFRVCSQLRINETSTPRYDESRIYETTTADSTVESEDPEARRLENEAAQAALREAHGKRDHPGDSTGA